MAEPGDKIYVIVDGEPVLTEIDDEGVQRFIKNEVIEHLVNSGSIDLHKLYIYFLQHNLDTDSYIEFYMSLGLSVCAFEEKFGIGSSWEDNGKKPIDILNPLWLEDDRGTTH